MLPFTQLTSVHSKPALNHGGQPVAFMSRTLETDQHSVAFMFAEGVQK